MFNPYNFLSDEEIESFFDSLVENTPPYKNTGVLYEDTPFTWMDNNNSNKELYQVFHSQPSQQLQQQNPLCPSYFSTVERMPKIRLADIVLSQKTLLNHPTTANNKDQSVLQFRPPTSVPMGMPSPLEEAPPQGHEATVTMTQCPYQQYLGQEEFLAMNSRLNSGVVQNSSVATQVYQPLVQFCSPTPVLMGMPSPLEGARPQAGQVTDMSTTMTQFPDQRYLKELAMISQLNSGVVQHSSVTAETNQSPVQFCPLTPVSMGMPSPLGETPPQDQEVVMTMTQFPYQQYLKELALKCQLNSDVVQHASVPIKANKNQTPTHWQREGKRRTKFTKLQLTVLETEFLTNDCPKASRARLAQYLNLSELQVITWFQNRKRKHKRSKQNATNQRRR